MGGLGAGLEATGGSGKKAVSREGDSPSVGM